jgi:predicted  nucleic acid-binding Zn-ribbon protein
MAQQTTMNGMEPGTSEVCPPNYSASERRCLQLRATISQIMSDIEQIDDEIFEQEDILAQYLELHHIETPIARESLMVGPFNNTELRRVFSQMSVMAETTLDEAEKDDLLFCMDVLSGESKILARRMEEIKSKFDRDCVAKQEELDSLVTKALRLQHDVDKLGGKMDHLTRKTDSIQPISPSIRKELQKEIEIMGDTNSVLRQVAHEVERLRKERESLKARAAAINAELVSQAGASFERTNEMEETVRLKQLKTKLEMQRSELEFAEKRNESNIAGAREAIEQSHIVVAASSSKKRSFRGINRLNHMNA